MGDSNGRRRPGDDVGEPGGATGGARIGRTWQDSTPHWPDEPRPPAGAPTHAGGRLGPPGSCLTHGRRFCTSRRAASPLAAAILLS